MLCLGIESTAHTFGCALVDKKGRVRADARDAYKAPEGKGIHPREASRHHIEVSAAVLKQALDNASVSMKDVDIVGYSAGPGLGPCLRVGAVVARTIAGYYKKPLVPVNHALGHIELGHGPYPGGVETPVGDVRSLLRHPVQFRPAPGVEVPVSDEVHMAVRERLI